MSFSKLDYIDNETIITAANLNNIQDELIRLGGFFPIGSCYTTSTNTNPSTWLGGTWELIDKRFKGAVLSGATLFTINSTNISSLSSCYAVLSGNTIDMRISVVNAVAFSDTALQIGTINLSAIGVDTKFHITKYLTSCYCDAANAVTSFTVANSTGVVTVTESAGNSGSTGLTYHFHITASLKYTTMLDNFCDQFIWKRTA